MDTNTIIKQSIEAIKQGDKSNARTLLENVVKNEPRNEEAWLLLAHVAQTQEQARSCLERVLNIDPNNGRAKKQLEKLKAMPSNKQVTLQPVKAKESKAILYLLLIGINALLLVITVLLAGLWLNQDNIQSATSSPKLELTTTPSTTNITLIPRWEYMVVSITCVSGADCIIFPDPHKYPDLVSALNELGQQGWEVIYVNPINSVANEFLLKRSIIEK
jgi:tetratricopeptide (TPR) repeat protein